MRNGTLPSQDHRANGIWVIQLTTKDDVQHHLSGINFPTAQRMWDDFPHETRRAYVIVIPRFFSRNNVLAKIEGNFLDTWNIPVEKVQSSLFVVLKKQFFLEGNYFIYWI